MPGRRGHLRPDQGSHRAAGVGASLSGARLRRPFRAVVLDFDGLIVDTETPIYEAWLEAYERHGQHLGLELWERALGTHGAFDPLSHLDSLCGGALDRDATLAEVDERSNRGCETLGLMPGVEALLRDALRLGLGRGCASSSSARWVEGWLRRHDVHGLFDVIVTRDDAWRVKPDPELFLLAAQRLQLDAAACVAFEDSPNGIRAAKAAGMCCVAVPNALTRRIDLPPVDLVVPSLAEQPLSEILRLLAP